MLSFNHQLSVSVTELMTFANLDARRLVGTHKETLESTEGGASQYDSQLHDLMAEFALEFVSLAARCVTPHLFFLM
eukprot:SAG31_NODE_6603_length_1955_cov_1.674569_3_plen_76_part_00